MVKRIKPEKRRLKRAGGGERDAIFQPREKVLYATDGSDNAELLSFLKSRKGPEQRFNKWLDTTETFARKTLEEFGYTPEEFFNKKIENFTPEDWENGCIEHRLRKKHGDISEPGIALDVLQHTRLLRKQLEHPENTYFLMTLVLDVHQLADRLLFIKAFEEDAASGRDHRLSGQGSRKYSQKEKDEWLKTAEDLIRSQPHSFLTAGGRPNISHIARKIESDMDDTQDRKKPFETIRRHLTTQLKKK